MIEHTCKPRSRTRRFWDKYGSWLILILVVGITWNAATEWEGAKTRDLIKSVLELPPTEQTKLLNILEKVDGKTK